MKTALYVAYFALSAVHLYACYFRRIRIRYATKPFLMLTLSFIYLISAAEFVPAVFIGVLFGMLGDIFLLMRRNKVFFGIGLVSFAVGHVLYISVLLRHAFTVQLPIWQYVLLALPFAAAVGVCLARLQPHVPRALKPATPVYMLLLSALGFMTLSFMLTSGATAGVLLFAGALCFIVSDSILAFHTFKYKDRAGATFYVMLTYIAAQFLLVSGFMRL